uniref:Secreted protein n=1 Tax=Cacopsylla melanoneura TaxID=428564 RepID=A0A8D8SNY0_9HEMI
MVGRTGVFLWTSCCCSGVWKCRSQSECSKCRRGRRGRRTVCGVQSGSYGTDYSHATGLCPVHATVHANDDGRWRHATSGHAPFHASPAPSTWTTGSTCT